MADDEPRATSFLKSTTGLVTAAATLIAAVAGLIAALTQLGGGHSVPTTAAQQTPAGTAAAVPDDAGRRELLSHVPPAIRPSCGPPKDAEATAVAAINCSYRSVVGLQYDLFASTKELEDDYADVKRRYHLTDVYRGSCGRSPSEAATARGRVLCFVDSDGVASIVWSDTKLGILSFAFRDDGKLPALEDAWRGGFGPSG